MTDALHVVAKGCPKCCSKDKYACKTSVLISRLIVWQASIFVIVRVVCPKHSLMGLTTLQSNTGSININRGSRGSEIHDSNVDVWHEVA